MRFSFAPMKTLLALIPLLPLLATAEEWNVRDHIPLRGHGILFQTLPWQDQRSA